MNRPSRDQVLSIGSKVSQRVASVGSVITTVKSIIDAQSRVHNNVVGLGHRVECPCEAQIRLYLAVQPHTDTPGRDALLLSQPYTPYRHQSPSSR